jgi:two-component system response regulator CpxR
LIEGTLLDRVLIVDDDKELCELVTEYLQPEGFDVESVHNPADGLAHVNEQSYNVVVLDVMLPGISGFELLKKIRLHSMVPVIMLTARGEEADRIVGLELGADDYLPKPFNPRELIARIRAILRRTTTVAQNEAQTQRFSVGDIVMDIGKRTISRGGNPVILTSVEFAILERLIRSAGSVVTRQDLSEQVLDRKLTPYDRSIDMHISNLRKKLGHRIGDTERIKTIRSTGYVYALTEPFNNSNKE